MTDGQHPNCTPFEKATNRTDGDIARFTTRQAFQEADRTVAALRAAEGVGERAAESARAAREAEIERRNAESRQRLDDLTNDLHASLSEMTEESNRQGARILLVARDTAPSSDTPGAREFRVVMKSKKGDRPDAWWEYSRCAIKVEDTGAFELRDTYSRLAGIKGSLADPEGRPAVLLSILWQAAYHVRMEQTGHPDTRPHPRHDWG